MTTRTYLVRTGASSYERLTFDTADAHAAMTDRPERHPGRLLAITETTTGDLWIVAPPSGAARQDFDGSRFLAADDLAEILAAFAAWDAEVVAS